MGLTDAPLNSGLVLRENKQYICPRMAQYLMLVGSPNDHVIPKLEVQTVSQKFVPGTNHATPRRQSARQRDPASNQYFPITGETTPHQHFSKAVEIVR